MIANEHAKLTGTPVGTNAMRDFIETTLFLHSAFYEPRTGLPGLRSGVLCRMGGLVRRRTRHSHGLPLLPAHAPPDRLRTIE
jgi:hypothetical protein